MSRLLIPILAVLAAACSSSVDVSVSTTPTTVEVPTTTTTVEAPTTTTTAPTTTTTVDPIDELVVELSLEQKVGQLPMPILAGTVASEPTAAEAAANRRIAGVDSMAEAVERYGLGGVLYLGDNVTSAPQLTALSAGIDQASRSVLPGVGALISVDQEGGRVNRVTDGVEVFPPARTLSPNAELVRSAASVTGTALHAQGINVVLAPVADLTDSNAGVIGDRSYGADPEVTARMVEASVEGLQGAGVAAAVKHWPGHGATSTGAGGVT